MPDIYKKHNMAIKALLAAIQTDDQTTAKKILQQKTYSNIDSQLSGKDGTALFWACCRGLIEIVHLLILHGADINKKTSWGQSPLHASVDNGHVEIVKLLLRFGAEVNTRTNSGDTPCHLASYRGYGECVQALAEYGADITSSNNKQHTPVDEALSMGHYNIYQYLIAVRSIALKYQTSPAHCSERESIRPTFTFTTTNSGHNTANKSHVICSSSKSSAPSSVLTSLTVVGDHEGYSETRESVKSDLSSTGFGENAGDIVGVLHVPSCTCALVADGVSSLDSSFSDINDLSSVSTGISPSEASLTFRNIP